VFAVEKMDDTDKKIIYLLSQNPELPQNELSKRLGISQPSVCARLQKLKRMRLITFLVGLNVKKTGLHLAKIDLTAKRTEDILGFFKKCPLYLYGFITSGKSNVSILLAGEDASSMEATIDRHLRLNPNIEQLSFDIVISAPCDFAVPMRFSLD
jgi:Lrp/AsnC family leucine-responsive transcriptional regulator